MIGVYVLGCAVMCGLLAASSDAVHEALGDGWQLPVVTLVAIVLWPFTLGLMISFRLRGGKR